MKMKKCYLYFRDGVLSAYDDVTTNNAFFFMPLYKIRFTVRGFRSKKMLNVKTLIQFIDKNLTRQIDVLEEEVLLEFIHHYDTSTIRLKLSQETNLNILKQIINLLENCINPIENSEYYFPLGEHNFYMQGKFFINMLSIHSGREIKKMFVKIEVDPYKFRTKTLSHGSILQTFALPIHNHFCSINFKIYAECLTGIFNKNISEELIAEESLPIIDFLRMQKSSSSLVLRIPEKDSDNEISLKLKITDYTSILYLINDNKNVAVEDINKSDNTISIPMIIKRAKRLSSLAINFFLGYKNLFRFKHPRVSYLVWLCITLYVFFCDTNYIFAHVFFLVIFTFIFNSPLLDSLSETRLYLWLTEENSLETHSSIKTKIEVGIEESADTSYFFEEKKVNFYDQIVKPLKDLKELPASLKNIVFSLNLIVTALEKAKNMFCWTDKWKSSVIVAFVFLLFVCTCYLPFKWLLLFGASKKFINGLKYFLKKQTNNKEIARITAIQALLKYNKKLGKTVTLNNESDASLLKNFSLSDGKLKVYLKEYLEKNLNVTIPEVLIANAFNCFEIYSELSKVTMLLNFVSNSSLQRLKKRNKKLYTPSTDIEEILYYFSKNIKSDYFLEKNKKQ